MMRILTAIKFLARNPTGQRTSEGSGTESHKAIVHKVCRASMSETRPLFPVCWQCCGERRKPAGALPQWQAPHGVGFLQPSLAEQLTKQLLSSSHVGKPRHKQAMFTAWDPIACSGRAGIRTHASLITQLTLETLSCPCSRYLSQHGNATQTSFFKEQIGPSLK